MAAGITSQQTLKIAREISLQLGVIISPVDTLNHPTVSTLANCLANKLGLVNPQVQLPLAVSGGSVPSSGPLVITGTGCRAPGGVNTPDQFFQLFSRSIDTLQRFPAGRLDKSKQLLKERGIYVNRAHFLYGVDKFDHKFFAISSREAASMDPHQRQLLEVAYSAMAAANQTRENVKGTDLCVF